MIELTGPILMKNSKRRIAWAPVLIPGEADSDGEVVSKDTIERVAHEWMASYRNIDREHTLNNVDAVPVESYITPNDLMVKMGGEDVVIPGGSWILATKFSPEDWVSVEKGEWAGYSIMGVPRAATKSVDMAEKRTLLADLGEDWVVTHVSVVGAPAVPKAKWFALKSAQQRKGILSRIFDPDPIPVVEKEGRKISAARLERLRAIQSELDSLIKEASIDREEDEDDEILDTTKVVMDDDDDEKDKNYKTSPKTEEIVNAVRAAIAEATRA